PAAIEDVGGAKGDRRVVAVRGPVVADGPDHGDDRCEEHRDDGEGDEVVGRVPAPWVEAPDEVGGSGGAGRHSVSGAGGQLAQEAGDPGGAGPATLVVGDRHVV